MQEQKGILIQGATIHTLVGGQGAPLVLLPSAAGRATDYQALFPELEKHFEVFALDYPGFGLSEDLPDLLDVAGFATFLFSWMDALGLKQSHIAGFSMGGWIALAMAHQAPLRLVRLILVASSGGLLPAVPLLNPADLSFKEILDHFYYRSEVKTRLLQQKRSPLEKRAIYRSHRAFSRLMNQGGLLPDMHHLLHEVLTPVLVVGAEQDCAIPLPYQERLHAGLPHSELCIFPETGHAILEERPQKLAQVMIDFLKKAERP